MQYSTPKHDRSRDIINQVAKSSSLTGVGLEIGVQRGYFSHQILTQTDLKLLISVDIWYTADEFQEAHFHLNPFGTRSCMVKLDSETASSLFQNHFFDYIHIDANHTYEYIQQDLKLWWPKLKPGGLFSGHDYMEGHHNGEFFQKYGVIEAVNDFVAEHDRQLYVTDSVWKSWYFFKKSFM